MTRTTSDHQRWASLAAAGIIVFGLIVIAWTVADYGASWDEPEQCRYAERTLHYFQSRGADVSYKNLAYTKYNNTLVDLTAALVYRWLPEAKYIIRHSLSAILGLLTVPVVYRFGRRIGGPWAGVVAGLFIVFTPQFYGHAFINTKDVPFACFFAWTMEALASLLSRGTFRLREFLVFGLCAGLTAAVRPGGLILLAMIAATTFGYALVVHRDALNTWLRGLIASVIVAWIVMVVPWPWAHENVVLNPIKGIRAATEFPNVIPVVFEGATYWSNDLPRRYLLEFLAITTPLPMLALAIVGMAVGIRRLVADPKGALASRLGIASIWTILPVAIWTATRSNIYDGLRHFLFVLPSLAVWAGYGAIWLCGTSNRRFGKTWKALAVGIAVLWPVGHMVRLHPYQMTYYNELVGGVRGASGRFTTEYWITSYKEAIEWINGQARGSPNTVYVTVATFEDAAECASYFKAINVNVFEASFIHQITGPLLPGVDYYVGTTRDHRDENYADSPIVHVVGREGAVFTVIRARKGLPVR